MEPRYGEDLVLFITARCPGCRQRHRIQTDRVNVIQYYPNESRDKETIAVIEVKCESCGREYDVQLDA